MLLFNQLIILSAFFKDPTRNLLQFLISIQPTLVCYPDARGQTNPISERSVESVFSGLGVTNRTRLRSLVAVLLTQD